MVGAPAMEGAAKEDKEMIQWTRSNTLALSREKCYECRGRGLKRMRGSEDVPCACVLRNIFRACYRKFRECAIKDRAMAQPMLEYSRGRGPKLTWGRKSEEFAADFFLVSRRYLTPREYKLFRHHYLMEEPWRVCCARLGIDKVTFFREAYRIEAKLGRVYAELKPYALFPLQDYFSNTTRERVYSSLRLQKVITMPAPAERTVPETKPLNNPLEALPKAA